MSRQALRHMHPRAEDLDQQTRVAWALRPIYTDRWMQRRPTLQPDRRKVTLIVLYIPSVERDGHTLIEQDAWVQEALDFFGAVFGGATAFPKARGIWRDSERNDALIYDEPVMLHCYVDPKQLASDEVQQDLGDFCRRLGRETRQGEVGLIIDNEYFAFTKF